jgi:hypothetical protein
MCKTNKNLRLGEAGPVNTLMHGHKFHYNYLYQINYFAVKNNFCVFTHKLSDNQSR